MTEASRTISVCPGRISKDFLCEFVDVGACPFLVTEDDGKRFCAFYHRYLEREPLTKYTRRLPECIHLTSKE